MFKTMVDGDGFPAVCGFCLVLVMLVCFILFWCSGRLSSIAGGVIWFIGVCSVSYWIRSLCFVHVIEQFWGLKVGFLFGLGGWVGVVDFWVSLWVAGLLSSFSGVFCWVVYCQAMLLSGFSPLCFVHVVEQFLVWDGNDQFGYPSWCGGIFFCVIWVFLGYVDLVVASGMLPNFSNPLSSQDLGIYFLSLISFYYRNYHYLSMQIFVFAGIWLGLNADFSSCGFALFWFHPLFWVLILVHRSMFLGFLYFWFSSIPDLLGFIFFLLPLYLIFAALEWLGILLSTCKFSFN